MVKPRRTQPAVPRLRDIETTLANMPLPRIMDLYLEQSNDPLSQQVRSLEERLADDLPAAVKLNLGLALKALREAKAAVDQPILTSIAEAILKVCRKYHVPLRLGSNGAQNGHAGMTRRGANQRWVLEYVKQQAGAGRQVRVSDVTVAAEEAGLNRSSVAQAIQIMVRSGRLKTRLPATAQRNPYLLLP